MNWPFVIRQTYVRRTDIHEQYGGQQQNGISTPVAAPGIFIFTGHGASTVGYTDAFQADGSLKYTGQGQVGDMKMTFGNLAIRDHSSNGKDILVFEQMKKGGRVRFLGLFVCAGWETAQQNDVQGKSRSAIVFALTPLHDALIEDAEVETSVPQPGTLSQLRARAYFAAKDVPAKTSGGPASVYARSRDVRDYVLARADGACEGCEQPAPFITANGRPFLEAHHIRKLSDGGPDDPGFMAGVCPNCHRRAHHGSDRVEFNQLLRERVGLREQQSGPS